MVLGVSVLLFVLGIVSCAKMELGLNSNVSLVEGSDVFKYFDTLFDIGEAGPPAYLVFNNVNYSDNNNILLMSQMQIELAQLNQSVISPIYTWVS